MTYRAIAYIGNWVQDEDVLHINFTVADVSFPLTYSLTNPRDCARLRNFANAIGVENAGTITVLQLLNKLQGTSFYVRVPDLVVAEE